MEFSRFIYILSCQLQWENILFLSFHFVCLLFFLPNCSGYAFQYLLNKSENGYPCYVPDLTEKAFNILPLNMLVVDFSYTVIMLSHIPSLPLLWRVSVMSFCVKYFFCIYWFSSFICLMWYITLIYCWILNHSWVLGINPTWSRYKILSMYC